MRCKWLRSVSGLETPASLWSPAWRLQRGCGLRPVDYNLETSAGLWTPARRLQWTWRLQRAWILQPGDYSLWTPAGLWTPAWRLQRACGLRPGDSAGLWTPVPPRPGLNRSASADLAHDTSNTSNGGRGIGESRGAGRTHYFFPHDVHDCVFLYSEREVRRAGVLESIKRATPIFLACQ